MIWRSLTHQVILGFSNLHGCELLSICDLTIFDTPIRRIASYTASLWIAFNLWFDDLWHTPRSVKRHSLLVVNCFQFVIWRSLTHRMGSNTFLRASCELLSICDLTIFDTPSDPNSLRTPLLWIAFNLWFDDLWHTKFRPDSFACIVVNCFQFVIWRSLTHQSSFRKWERLSCELLSICDLTIFDTPSLALWLRD